MEEKENPEMEQKKEEQKETKEAELSEEDKDILTDTSSKKSAADEILSKKGIKKDEGSEEIEEELKEKIEKKPEKKKEDKPQSELFALRTTANRESQVMDFVSSNAKKKKLEVYSVVQPHGMRGYIFIEAASRSDAEQATFNVPYARGVLPKPIDYKEVGHMLEQVKREVNIRKNDIVEIISGPFKRENAKIKRIDKVKEEVVVELLEAAVPIPMTMRMDAVKVIRRDSEEKSEENDGEESETGVNL